MNRKTDFFCKTNRFESIRITNRIHSNRELECSSHCCNRCECSVFTAHAAAAAAAAQVRRVGRRRCTATKCCRSCHGTACDFGVRNRKHRLCCTEDIVDLSSALWKLCDELNVVLQPFTKLLRPVSQTVLHISLSLARASRSLGSMLHLSHCKCFVFTAHELNRTDLQQVDPVTRGVHWPRASASRPDWLQRNHVTRT